MNNSGTGLSIDLDVENSRRRFQTKQDGQFFDRLSNMLMRNHGSEEIPQELALAAYAYSRTLAVLSGESPLRQWSFVRVNAEYNNNYYVLQKSCRITNLLLKSEKCKNPLGGSCRCPDPKRNVHDRLLDLLLDPLHFKGLGRLGMPNLPKARVWADRLHSQFGGNSYYGAGRQVTDMLDKYFGVTMPKIRAEGEGYTSIKCRPLRHFYTAPCPKDMDSFCHWDLHRIDSWRTYVLDKKYLLEKKIDYSEKVVDVFRLTAGKSP